jgi:hypothetical protein
MPRSRTISQQSWRPDEPPPPGTSRWIARRKWQVVNAVRAGRISLEEACQRYRLSLEEFEDWARVVDTHGVRGLRLGQVVSRRRQKQSRHTTPSG